MTHLRVLVTAGVVLVLLCALVLVVRGRAAAEADYRVVPVKRTSFAKIIRRKDGSLKPVREHNIIGKIWGTITEMVPQGALVEKDQVLVKLDATPHEDWRLGHEAWMAQLRAENKKQRQWSSMQLNQAKQDVASAELRLELQQLLLDEYRKGPGASEVINARTNLENCKNLLGASQEELKSIEDLAQQGFTSKQEVRQKRLAVQEQQLALTEADIAHRKLFVPDAVKLAEQQLKVQDASKALNAAKEKIEMMERNIQRDLENFERRMQREQKQLERILENIDKTLYKAPAAGIVVYKKPRWYAYAPGRDVGDGLEIMALPDFSSMKVAFTVDEARIAHVAVGQEANVTPAGWAGAPFKAKITKVADKGRDEFEQYANETKGITGTADRQVFDVEAEIQGNSQVFRPGLRADVEIIIQALASALVVPRAAVFRDKDEAFVRVRTPSGVERRKVKVQGESELLVAIEGALQENELVYIVDLSE